MRMGRCDLSCPRGSRASLLCWAWPTAPPGAHLDHGWTRQHIHFARVLECWCCALHFGWGVSVPHARLYIRGVICMKLGRPLSALHSAAPSASTARARRAPAATAAALAGTRRQIILPTVQCGSAPWHRRSGWALLTHRHTSWPSRQRAGGAPPMRMLRQGPGSCSKPTYPWLEMARTRGLPTARSCGGWRCGVARASGSQSTSLACTSKATSSSSCTARAAWVREAPTQPPVCTRLTAR